MGSDDKSPLNTLPPQLNKQGGPPILYDLSMPTWRDIDKSILRIRVKKGSWHGLT